MGDGVCNVGSSMVLGMLWKPESEDDSHCMCCLDLCGGMSGLVVDDEPDSESVVHLIWSFGGCLLIGGVSVECAEWIEVA